MFPTNQILIWNNIYSLFLMWILWLAAAAAITQILGGALNCYIQTYVVYCSQLNALQGFAWLIWCVAVPLRHLIFWRPQCSNQGGADLDACFCSYPKHQVGTSRQISGRGLILWVGTFTSFFLASESRLLIYKSTQSWNLIPAPAIQWFLIILYSTFLCSRRRLWLDVCKQAQSILTFFEFSCWLSYLVGAQL